MKKNDFVERLDAYIAARPDLTPSRLSLDAGLDNSAIRALLSGKAKQPRLDTALAICAALGTSLERFMSADIRDLRAGKIPRARITDPSDPLDQRILELIETLAHEERLRLLGYAEALTALAPSQQRTNAAAPEDPSPETTKSEQ